MRLKRWLGMIGYLVAVIAAIAYIGWSMFHVPLGP